MVEETPWQQSLRYENRLNPYPFYEELRKTPVSREPDGSYVVSTYREVVQLLHDPGSAPDITKRPGATQAGAELGPDSSPLTQVVRHPDQLEKLRRRPELIVPGGRGASALGSSVQLWHTRTALEDIEIAGTTIPAGAGASVFSTQIEDRSTPPSSTCIRISRPNRVGQ